jgi:hypothetical protein
MIHHARLEFLIRVRDRFDSSNTAYFVTIFDNTADQGNKLKALGDVETRNPNAKKTGDGMMLSPVVYGLNHPEPRRFAWSAVWLKRADNLNGIRPNPFEHSICGPRFPAFCIQADGEGSRFLAVEERLWPFEGKFSSKHVQCSPQVMGVVGSENPKSERWWAKNVSPHDVLAIYGLVWGGESIGWRKLHHEHPRFMLQCVNMLHRPLKPGFNPIQLILVWNAIELLPASQSRRNNSAQQPYADRSHTAHPNMLKANAISKPSAEPLRGFDPIPLFL